MFNPQSDIWSVRHDLSIPTLSPGSKDILVKVTACGLNPVDAKISLWKGLMPAMNSGHVAGLDVYGVVVGIGEGVSGGFSIGEHVLYHGNMFRPCGGFAEFAVQDAETAINIDRMLSTMSANGFSTVSPEDLNDIQFACTLASSPCAAWTAYRALFDKLHIDPADSLVVIGASGGVGSFALQLARQHGLTRVAAVCSGKNAAYVRALGASHVVDYTVKSITEGVRDFVRDTEGDESALLVDKVLDCIGKCAFALLCFHANCCV